MTVSKNDEVNKHVQVFNITRDKSHLTKKLTLKVVQCDLNSIQNYAMRFAVLRVELLKVHFLICFEFDHNTFSMDYVRMNALYKGSLRMKISYFYPEESNSL